MLEARRNEQWDHTATIMALLANINRDPKKRSKPFSFEDFHPTRVASEEVEEKPPQVPITFLRDIFCKPAGVHAVKLTPGTVGG